MSNASSTAFSLWAILSVLFQIFLIHHLWCYDRFKCLRWTAGRQPGAFKRVMTYTYLAAVPLFAIYSVGMTIIKVREGFAVVPGEGTIVPVPINQYREANRVWVLPLQFVFSFAWALEQVTHLEELAFWLYLLHQNPNKEAWFSSWEYRLWYMGSVAAIIGMPLTALITREDLVTCDAYIFLVGSAGSTLTTIAFLYVLWRFPRFIKHVKVEGADPSVVVRLATFYQLNQVRVVFRFLFTTPLLILALDGIIGTTHPINRNLFATDFLQMFAGLGCIVSSMITLLIFFPRSIVREAGYKPKPASLNSPTSPKSPALHGGAPYSPTSHPLHPHSALPAHMAAYAPHPARMSATGATGYSYTTGTGVTWEVEGSAYTASVLSPRESLHDLPVYSAEDGAEPASAAMTPPRRGSRVSRRASVYSRRHRGLDEDDGAYSLAEEDEDELDEDGKGAGVVVVGEVDAPREGHVPPYPHAPTQLAQLHHRQPLPHARSSPHLAAGGRSASPPPPPSSTPQPHSPPADAPPPTPPPPLGKAKAKRRTWDWEDRRSAPPLGRARSLHLIASTTGPGAVAAAGGGSGAVGNMSVNLVNLNTGPGAAVVGQTRARAGGGGGGSSLHPYVVNFTSPIDLVDLPPHDELPRA